MRPYYICIVYTIRAFFQIVLTLRSQKRLKTHNSIINRDDKRKRDGRRQS